MAVKDYDIKSRLTANQIDAMTRVCADDFYDGFLITRDVATVERILATSDQRFVLESKDGAAYIASIADWDSDTVMDDSEYTVYYDLH